jgi:hypothetical protein
MARLDFFSDLGDTTDDADSGLARIRRRVGRSDGTSARRVVRRQPAAGGADAGRPPVPGGAGARLVGSPGSLGPADVGRELWHAARERLGGPVRVLGCGGGCPPRSGPHGPRSREAARELSDVRSQLPDAERPESARAVRRLATLRARSRARVQPAAQDPTHGVGADVPIIEYGADMPIIEHGGDVPIIEHGADHRTWRRSSNMAPNVPHDLGAGRRPCRRRSGSGRRSPGCRLALPAAPHRHRPSPRRSDARAPPPARPTPSAWRPSPRAGPAASARRSSRRCGGASRRTTVACCACICSSSMPSRQPCA